MKSIYELPEAEKKKYREEFKNLTFAKNIARMKKSSIIMAALMIIIPIVMAIVDPKLLSEENMGAEFFADLFYLAIIIYLFNVFYLNICFYRWMKIKHKIEY